MARINRISLKIGGDNGKKAREGIYIYHFGNDEKKLAVTLVNRWAVVFQRKRGNM